MEVLECNVWALVSTTGCGVENREVALGCELDATQEYLKDRESVIATIISEAICLTQQQLAPSARLKRAKFVQLNMSCHLNTTFQNVQQHMMP